MKRITRKEFMQRYVYGFKNYLSNKGRYLTNEIAYCPEHKLLEFKLPYKFPCICVYDRKKDVTILFFYCAGIVNLELCADEKEGIMLRFKGNQIDNLTEKLSNSSKFLSLLNDEYTKYENEARSKYITEERKEAEEELHKSFEDFEEELKKVTESMGA